MRSSESPSLGWGFLVIASLVLLLAACGPAATPTPSPTPVPVVHVSPSAAPFAYSLGRAYVQDQGPLPFDLVPMGSGDARREVELGQAALLIDLPPVPEGWFGTPLGRDGLTFVVNERTGVRDLGLGQLRDLFTGRIDTWDEISATEQAVAVIVPPRGDPLRTYFESAVMDDQLVDSGALLAPTPRRVAEIVAQTPGAIALLPLSEGLPEGVRRVRVEGELPSSETIADGSYPFNYHVLAMAPSEPSGAIREWLIWVQGSQSAVARP